jgi:hypothetical protein
LRTASIVAFLLGGMQLFALLVAAYLDGTLWLRGPAVGLLEHPGIFSIIAGDVALVIICTLASQMTCRMGRRLPTRHPDLTARYFRRYLGRRMFGPRGWFSRVFFFLFIVGVLTLADQTVRLFDSQHYYGHPTFGDWGHDYCFVTLRIVLFLSWCVVAPLFFAYLMCHAIAIRIFLRVVERHNLAYFDERHPDRCGGYAFFGWIDTLYALGIFVVLVEIVLVIITHGRVTLGNVLAICALAVGALIISIFSIWEMLRLVRRQERALKLKTYARNRRSSTPTTLDLAILNFGLTFSPYTRTAFRLAVGLRALIAAPAVLRVVQYVNAAT